MSQKETTNPDPAVPVKSFPQLENSSDAAAAPERPGKGPGLHAVPAPSTQPANSISTAPATFDSAQQNLGALADVPVTLVFEVGQQNITVQQLMELARGSIVPLQNVFVDSIKVKVSGKTIARAEAINLKQRYGIRISEIVIPLNMAPK